MENLKVSTSEDHNLSEKNIFSLNITFIRFFVCIFMVFLILFFKKNNTAVYSSIKDIYITESCIEIVDKNVLLEEIYSAASLLSDFLSTCTTDILRSVTF